MFVSSANTVDPMDRRLRLVLHCSRRESSSDKRVCITCVDVILSDSEFKQTRKYVMNVNVSCGYGRAENEDLQTASRVEGDVL